MKIYDNSNIAESYAGVTTPLTSSFARYVYQEVYKYFSQMMGANEKLIKENFFTFEHMIEFIGYRIYYNLNSWYKMLSFFPGYKFSSEFMEKMMGVEKHISFNEEVEYSFFQKYLFYFPQTFLQTIKISLTFILMKWRMENFNEYFKRVFSKLDEVELSKLSLQELKNLYSEADDKLLSRWRIPIANDFAVMVSAGLADKLFKKWLNSNDSYLYMETSVNKPLITLDPGNRVIRIVNSIKKDKNTKKLFLSQTPEKEIIRQLYKDKANHHVTHEINNYLKAFGTRMPNELKLESETMTENPQSFITLIKKVVQSELVKTESPNTHIKESVYKKLGFIKRVFLKWLLRWAGNSIRRREEARFHRTFIFGFIRKIFLAIGKEMQRMKTIKNNRDIFYLSVEEVFNIIDSKKIDTDILSTIKQRKLEYRRWQKIELPRRFETSKNVSELEQELLSEPTVTQRQTLNGLIGRVASRPNGIQKFSGLALTLKEFNPTADFKDKILVTCQTDPGWTIIFPLLRGLVVERGGMLSHAAIVARELKIPCIVGVQQATDMISNNMRITLDLENGLIHET